MLQSGPDSLRTPQSKDASGVGQPPDPSTRNAPSSNDALARSELMPRSVSMTQIFWGCLLPKATPLQVGGVFTRRLVPQRWLRLWPGHGWGEHVMH